jgi:hypothetical protein
MAQLDNLRTATIVIVATGLTVGLWWCSWFRRETVAFAAVTTLALIAFVTAYLVRRRLPHAPLVVAVVVFAAYLALWLWLRNR